MEKKREGKKKGKIKQRWEEEEEEAKLVGSGKRETRPDTRLHKSRVSGRGSDKNELTKHYQPTDITRYTLIQSRARD